MSLGKQKQQSWVKEYEALGGRTPCHVEDLGACSFFSGISITIRHHM